MKIIRVFPHRTNATPTDDLAFTFIGDPTLFAEEADEIHISVSFTWDLPEADRLAKAWIGRGEVKIGGPATGMVGGEFTPGMYLKEGYTITSRGCPNHCPFCDAWKRDGTIRELSIKDGWNILDDNLLACSDDHIRSVFSMLSQQKRRAEFTGGLEAARLKPWMAQAMKDIKAKQLFFAYDEESDYEPLVEASKILKEIGIIKSSSHAARCFVLIGFGNDTPVMAEKRLKRALALGYIPMAMLWRGKDGKVKPEFKRLRWEWSRPAIICSAPAHQRRRNHEGRWIC